MLKKRITLYLCLFSITAVFSVYAMNVSAQVPAEAEARLRAIYEGRDFRAKSIRATTAGNSVNMAVGASRRITRLIRVSH